MTIALTPAAIAGIERARWAVRRIAGEVPADLHGDQLVHALTCLLQCSADEANLGAVGIAAAAIAELVERDRGERSVAA